MPAVAESDLRARYDDYLHPDNPGRAFVALIGSDRVVGSSYAAFGDAGVNLFRKRGVCRRRADAGIYRALVRARLEASRLRAGQPALTVRAGRMSRPICEQLGFVCSPAPVRVFVDLL